MNNIYKVIWSKAKNCYVVASEIARSHTKSATGSGKIGGGTKRSLLASLMALSLLCGGLGVASAANSTVHVDESASGAAEVYTRTGVDTLLADYGRKTEVETNKNNIATLQTRTTDQGKQIAINTTNIANNATDIEKKIDTETANERFAAKVDLTALQNQVTGKVDENTFEDALDDKADKTYVDTEVGKKADKTYVDTEVGKKANKATTLAGYEITDAYTKEEVYNKGEVARKLDKKADLTALNQATDKINDQQTAIDDLKKKTTEISYADGDGTRISGVTIKNGNIVGDGNSAITQLANVETDKIETDSINGKSLVGTTVATAKDVEAEALARTEADNKLEEKITKNTQDIATLDGKVTTAQGNITALQAKDNELARNIQTNADNIQTNSNAIADINKRTAGIQRIDATKGTTIEGNVTVNSLGNVTAEGDVTAKGKLTGDGVDAGAGAITTKGAVNAGSLNVTDASHLKGDVTMDKTLSVTGDTSLNNTDVGGALNVTGESSLKNTQVNGTLTTTEKATFKEAVEMDKGLTVTSGDTTLQKTDVDGALSVTGESSLKNTTVDGTLSVNKETTLNGKLTANDEATFTKKVTMEKDLEVKGELKTDKIAMENKKTDADGRHNSSTAITADYITHIGEVENSGVITKSSFTHNEKGTINYAKDGDTADWKETRSYVTASGVSNKMTDSAKNKHTYSQTATESKEQLVNGDESKSNFEKKTAEGNTISITEKDAAGNVVQSLTNKQTVKGEKTSVTNEDSSSIIKQEADQIRHNVTSVDGKKSSTEVKADGITNTSKDGTITNDAKDIVNNATGNMTNTVGGKQTNKIDGNQENTIGGNQTTTVTGDISNKAENITNEANTKLTDKVGTNTRVIDSTSITDTVGTTTNRKIEDGKITDTAGDFTVTTDKANGTTFAKTGSTAYSAATGAPKDTNIAGNLITTGRVDANELGVSDKDGDNTADFSVKAGEGVKASAGNGTTTGSLDVKADEVGSSVKDDASGKGSTFKQRIDAIMGNVRTADGESEVTQKGNEITSKVGLGEASNSRVTQKKDLLEAAVTDGTNYNISNDTANASAKVLTDGTKVNKLQDNLYSSEKTITNGTYTTSKVQTALDITNTASDGTITNDAKNIVNNATGDMTNTVGGNQTNTIGGNQTTTVTGDISNKAKNITNEASDSITDKVGDHTRVLDSDGITDTVGGSTFKQRIDKIMMESKNVSIKAEETLTNEAKVITNKASEVINNEAININNTATGIITSKASEIKNQADKLISNKVGENTWENMENGKITTSIKDGAKQNLTQSDAAGTTQSTVDGGKSTVTIQNADGLTDAVTDGRNTSMQNQTASQIAAAVKDGAGNENASVANATTSANTIKSGSKANTVISTADGTSFINSEAAASVTGASGAGTALNTTIKGNTITTGKVTMDYADVMKDLGVRGSANIGGKTTTGSLEVKGESKLTGNVTMENNATVGNDLTVKGITNTKTLNVTEDAKVGRNLAVDGNATIAGDVTARSYKVDGKTYIDANGIHANGQKITDVADGSISEGSKDAVNGGQLYTVKNDLEGKVNKVGANAAAMANLHPMEFDPDSKWNIAAAIGNYGSETAAALGAFYRPNDDVMVNLSTAFGTGENMVGGGVSVRLGKGGNKLSREETNALKAQVADLTARMDALLSVLNPNMSKDFPDVPENHWAYEAVSRLAGNDIVQGYPDGEFHGERTMTRYEMAEIIYNALSRGAEAEKELVEEFKPELQAMAASEKATAERVEG